MLRSSEDPTNEEFIKKLIPTGSISMKNAMQDMEGTTTAQKMEHLYNLVCQLTQNIKDLIVRVTIFCPILDRFKNFGDLFFLEISGIFFLKLWRFFLNCGYFRFFIFSTFLEF